jgi:hypothetical protein
MLTQGESEIQDNIQTIASLANNRNQVKAIGFKGIAHDTTEFLAEQGSSEEVLTIEHHTSAITRGDMEIFIITV